MHVYIHEYSYGLRVDSDEHLVGDNVTASKLEKQVIARYPNHLVDDYEEVNNCFRMHVKRDII